MKIRVIVNPTAGAGAAGRKVPHIRRALADAGVPHDVTETGGPGDATALARRASQEGFDLIAVVGGDGTLNEVAQAFVDAEGNAVAGPAIALISAGTGGDFRRTIDMPAETRSAVARIVSGTPRPLDLGVVQLTSDRGEPVTRAFVNIASFGVSGRIDRLVNRSPKWMGGKVAFAIGSVRAMSTYRNARVSISVDGAPWYEGRIVVVAIANGRYFGGGMHVAPKADPSDGRFDVVAVGDYQFLDSVRFSPKLYMGKHLDEARVKSTRGAVVEASALGPEPVFIDVDGEAPGRLPLRARILPGALTLRA
jgi:YegS/Rv2252/BmrU family lipid kinase